MPSLQASEFLQDLRASIEMASERGDFRVVHYSIHGHDIHLLVEAAGKFALGCGMKAIAARAAHTANRVFGRRGNALYGRYQLRILRTPSEVRDAIAQVERPSGGPPDFSATGAEPHTRLLATAWR